MAEERLAVDGGEPFVKEPLPARTPFGEEEIELTTEAIRSQNLFGRNGPKTMQFEREYAELYGVKHTVASTSGTAAIHIAVGTINPEPGDEIITAPITDAGTIVPILYQGAIPIFADTDDTYNMDPEDVERKITDRTRAIIAVHLYGNPCNMDAMVDIARRHNLALIEDCSQAQVTKYKGKYVGTFGDIAAFSLQMSKHMTTGDGGMTMTNRDDLAERMKLFRDKGWAYKEGWGPRTYLFLAPNYRITELQSAVGIAQVRKIKRRIAKLAELGDLLTESIRDIEGLRTAPVTPSAQCSYWRYALGVDNWSAEKFARAMAAEGIGCGFTYIGVPIFLCMEACCSKVTFGTSQYPFVGPQASREYEYKEGMCPKAEELLQSLITIPLNENMSREDVISIAGVIRKVARLLPR